MPSSPLSVQVGAISEQPTRLSVTWQPPLNPNGIIIGYTAYCFETSDDELYGSGYIGETGNLPPSVNSIENITSNITVLGSESLAIVDGLDPFTHYACFVIASTSIGEGEPSYSSSAITTESSRLILYKSLFSFIVFMAVHFST